MGSWFPDRSCGAEPRSCCRGPPARAAVGGERWFPGHCPVQRGMLGVSRDADLPSGAMPSDGSDRRREPRAPIELRVEYKRLNTFFADYTKNISRGGTFIGTERPLEIGTEFIFALDLPTLAEPLRLPRARHVDDQRRKRARRIQQAWESNFSTSTTQSASRWKDRRRPRDRPSRFWPTSLLGEVVGHPTREKLRARRCPWAASSRGASFRQV